MTNGRQRLELTWIGKEKRPKLEPRILLGDDGKSYHANHRVTEQDRFDNRVIFGDNLLALKALEQEFTGVLRCVYIDPPYNTGSAFTHYEDGLEHSIWLSLMRDRLEILRRLLADNGTIWVSIDDNEQAYLRVLMDEVFGRENFVATVIWQKVFAPKNTERVLAMVLDNQSQRWLRPVKGQFGMYYRLGADQPEYVPDFVAETAEMNLVIETKQASEMESLEVKAKARTAVTWCRHASDYTAGVGGKPWRYLLVPHDALAANATIAGLVSRFAQS